jgi:rhomboid protease GluP
MTVPSADPGVYSQQVSAHVAFRGSKRLCQEFSLVLEARGIEHEMVEDRESWILIVPPDLAHRAGDEIGRYSVERSLPRSRPAAPAPAPFTGAARGSLGYVVILLLTAYCAGIGLFGADWLSSGDLDPAAPQQWWRPLTALTLHLDQEHLLGNLLFGVVAGIGAGRLLGPGVAWLSIMGAGVLANAVEMLIAPPAYRAVGASTAVFAALGLLVGLAWRQQLNRRERRWQAAAPVIAGVCLLTLLGAGNAHVDVVGHALGFLFGVGTGWLYARAGIPRNRGRRLQIAAGACAALLICAAWALALGHAA